MVPWPFMPLLCRTTWAPPIMFGCGILHMLPLAARWSLSALSKDNSSRLWSQNPLQAGWTISQRFCGRVGVPIPLIPRPISLPPNPVDFICPGAGHTVRRTGTGQASQKNRCVNSSRDSLLDQRSHRLQGPQVGSPTANFLHSLSASTSTPFHAFLL